MKIIHDSTIRIARGWQSIFRIENENSEDEALVVRHDAPTSRIIASRLEDIERAIARETILDRREFITQEISEQISETLINWLCQNKGLEIRYIRWVNNLMISFQTISEVQAYDNESRSEPEEATKRKKRIMLG